MYWTREASPAFFSTPGRLHSQQGDSIDVGYRVPKRLSSSDRLWSIVHGVDSLGQSHLSISASPCAMRRLIDSAC